jgi:UDP-N-acetylmuramoyl-L-alanyl-D-glutamate--2,6-diaminopimelate ligase
MKLTTIISLLSTLLVEGERDREIASVTFDSRDVAAGSLFVAVSGTESDGHKYIPQAIRLGATALVCENIPEERDEQVTWIQVKNSRIAISLIASAWYENPSEELYLTGITGTNGKTTIATLLYKVQTGLGYKAGLLSTNEVLINNKSYPATHTTPDPMQINAYLRQMVDEGCQYCFMEVSSHAASQHRIAGLKFKVAAFTNLTHEHLDYHKDFRDYLEAKRSFFNLLDKDAKALVNADDKNGLVMTQNSKAKTYTYSLRRMSEFRGKIIEAHFDGTQLQINEDEIWVRLTGKFNAYNLLAVYGVSLLLGHEKEQVLQVMSGLEAVEGRFQTMKGKNGCMAVIDYAHTDDALRNVLETIRDVDQEGREIISVLGAGGDRDKSKRPKMAAVASELSHKVILTSDNPRSEDTATIIEEMVSGIASDKEMQVLKIIDREEAIKTACMLAGEKSIILVAGKGHEKYQEIKGEKHPFDDKAIVSKYLK